MIYYFILLQVRRPLGSASFSTPSSQSTYEIVGRAAFFSGGPGGDGFWTHSGHCQNSFLCSCRAEGYFCFISCLFFVFFFAICGLGLYSTSRGLLCSLANALFVFKTSNGGLSLSDALDKSDHHFCLISPAFFYAAYL